MATAARVVVRAVFSKLSRGLTDRTKWAALYRIQNQGFRQVYGTDDFLVNFNYVAANSFLHFFPSQWFCMGSH